VGARRPSASRRALFSGLQSRYAAFFADNGYLTPTLFSVETEPLINLASTNRSHIHLLETEFVGAKLADELPSMPARG
jgi:hypothetical protein